MFLQLMRSPNSTSYVGKGKLAEIKDYVDEHEVNLVIFDDDLSPKQIAHIQKETKVKGYAAKFTALYNADAKPTFSVGEYFDGNKQLLTNWINGTKVNGVIQSAAFDFNTRYAVRDATNYSNWTKLDHDGLATDPTYARYAVTFVENHDTERRSASEQQDPIKRDTLAANAYILAPAHSILRLIQHHQLRCQLLHRHQRP